MKHNRVFELLANDLAENWSPVVPVSSKNLVSLYQGLWGRPWL